MLLIHLFIYLGIIAAGVSGALVGIKKELDLFGVVCLCIATSLGGGIVRDILIGNLPPAAFVDAKYFFVSLTSGLFTWIFYQKIKRMNHLVISDAIGLGVFTAVGSNTAMSLFSDNYFLILSMGLITGIGGGVLRDIFSKEIPYVFKKEVYAIASIVGALSFILIHGTVSNTFAMYVCLLVTFLIRIIAVIYKINFPIYREKTDLPSNL
ncbi:trimeric intracellular cation channel family protein [Cohnella endophytica]|uniref:Trimeric intracellular cation channel family protein n=1 Tax=Cohnella endophytica TaxID=2419778 RepID=A0A494X356_9BACL|nr:trimeric intracellular cation channel family protein [Cohnella endophytica]RKP44780.1 trimeric intracellular cation channel family protein [Cohnella endophytica]